MGINCHFIRGTRFKMCAQIKFSFRTCIASYILPVNNIPLMAPNCLSNLIETENLN